MVGGEGVTVVPLDVRAELERQVQAVAAEPPGFRHLADDVEIAVPRDEPRVDEAAHLVGGAVAGDVRDQAGDVAEQRLHQRVAVGGREILLAGAVVDGATHFAAAAGEETAQQEERRAPDLHLLRGRRGRGPPRGLGRGRRRLAYHPAAALAAYQRQAERGDGEDDGDRRRDLAQDGRRAHGAEDRLAAGAAEGGADVRALARLQEHHADDGEGRHDVDDDEQRVHHSPLTAAPARAVFLTMAMKPGALRLAPPTRAPSISGSAASASALSAFTLPP